MNGSLNELRRECVTGEMSEEEEENRVLCL